MPLVKLKSLDQLIDEGWVLSPLYSRYESPHHYPFIIDLGATAFLGKEVEVSFQETVKGKCFKILSFTREVINPPFYYFPVSVILDESNEFDTIIQEIRKEINN